MADLTRQTPMVETPQLHIRLLGQFSLYYGDRPISTVNTERSQSLLAYLLLHRDTPQSRQRLAAFFWPDSGEAQARTNLRRELHHLRHELPDADRFIESDAKTLRWCAAAPFTLDVAEFEQAIAQAELAHQQQQPAIAQAALERAAELYQGDLLPGCYDEWILPEQERLQQRCIQALERLIQHQQNQHDYRAALRYAQQLLRLDSLNEATYRILMQLYSQAGDRANAMRIYHQCVKVLDAELGVDPDPATRELYNGLLQVSLPVEPTPQPAQAVAPSPSEKIVLPLIEPRINHHPLWVGRDREWQTVQTWLNPADKGHSVDPDSSILLLLGEPGIGKTRLLEELAIAVQRIDGYILWGRGFEAERLRSYGAWIDTLRTLPPDLLAELPPELGGATELPHPGDRSTDRGRLFDVVVKLLLKLANHHSPLVIVMDDIQWLDEASTALLHYASRLLNNSPVRFAWASRKRELDDNAPVAKLIQAMRREQRLQTLELEALTAEQTTQLVHSINANLNGDRIFADSGGNPLFVLEVARALAEHDSTRSDNLEALIRDRLMQLDDATGEMLHWAAALGRSFSPTTLALVVDCPLTRLLAAMEELERQGIIRPGGLVNDEMGYDFAHDLVRQVAYRQISAPRRVLMHRHIARALQDHYAQDVRLASDVAHHASLGGDRKLAATACLTAAERCLRLFGYAEAAALAEQGIQHSQTLEAPVRIRLHINLLNVQVVAGVQRDRVAALEAELQQLIQEAQALGFKDEEATAYRILVILNFDHGNFASVHQASLQAIETIKAASPGTMAKMLAASGSCLAEIGRDMPHAEALLLEAQSLAARVGLDIADIPCGLGCVRLHTADFDDARTLLNQALHLATIEQDHWREGFCLTYLAMTELEAGQPEAAIPICRSLSTVAARMSGECSEGTFAIALEALAGYVMGLPEAEVALENAIQTLRVIDAKRMRSYVLTFAAEVDLKYGRADLAIAKADEAFQSAQVIKHPSETVMAWAALIHGMLALGRHGQAVDYFQALQRSVNHQDHLLSARARQAVKHLAQQLNP